MVALAGFVRKDPAIVAVEVEEQDRVPVRPVVPGRFEVLGVARDVRDANLVDRAAEERRRLEAAARRFGADVKRRAVVTHRPQPRILRLELSHGHALAFTTTVAHKFNNSKFYKKFKHLVKKLNFEPISLKQNFDIAVDTIMVDRKHLDYNTKIVTKEIIIELLRKINKKKISEI